MKLRPSVDLAFNIGVHPNAGNNIISHCHCRNAPEAQYCAGRQKPAQTGIFKTALTHTKQLLKRRA